MFLLLRRMISSDKNDVSYLCMPVQTFAAMCQLFGCLISEGGLARYLVAAAAMPIFTENCGFGSSTTSSPMRDTCVECIRILNSRNLCSFEQSSNGLMRTRFVINIVQPRPFKSTHGAFNLPQLF